MLYSIFLYQTKSGLLLFDKNFQDISHGKMELFSSFFSAIKSFIQEIVLEGSKDLKNIELGNYLVKITSIPQINVDIVVIIDKEDNKKANKIIPKIIKSLLKHQEIFMDWEGDKHVFDILDGPISSVIHSEKDLVDKKTLADDQVEILKSIWAKKGELTQEEIKNLMQEKEFLEGRLNTIENLIRKHNIIKKLIDISHDLKDDESFLKYQEQKQQIKNEIEDTKLKMGLFLKRAKETLSESIQKIGRHSLIQGDYKDAYINLYSFSTKIQKISSGDKYLKFRNMAKALIEKDESKENQLSQIITEILNLNEEKLEEYFD